MKHLEIYHHVWLEAHPTRTEEWLRMRLKDGFHIHHIDGDHSNNHPLNLVLIDGQDHMQNLHGMGWPKRHNVKRKSKQLVGAPGYGHFVVERRAVRLRTRREPSPYVQLFLLGRNP